MSAPNPFIFTKMLFQRLTQSSPSKNSEGHPRDIARLRRSIVRLHRENRRLKNQLSDLGIKRISDANNTFEAEPYRKALELNVKEEVFEKIRNIFGVIVLLGGLGLFFQLKSIVESSVTKEVNTNPQIVAIKDEFNKQKDELNKQLERSQRDTLLSLMQAAIGAADQGNPDSWAVKRIENNKQIPGYTQQMQELLKQESAVQERQLAIDYASRTKDRDLRDVLLAECHRSIEPKIRLRMLEALMQYPEETWGDTLEIVKQEGETSQGEFWQRAIQYLSILEIDNDIPVASEIMSRALQSEKQHIVRSAIAFFTLNPQTWKNNYANLISPKIQPVTELVLLKSLIQISTATDPALEEQTRVSQILAFLTDEAVATEESSEETSRWQGQLQNMQRRFAKHFLRFGNSRLLVALRDAGNQYYSYDDWEQEILTLFPEFEQKNAGAIRSAHTEEEQHKLQDRLIDTLDASVWNTSENVYNLFDLKDDQQFERASLQQLKQGDLTLFNRYFLEPSDGADPHNYAASRWSEVALLFPDAKPEQKQKQSDFRNWLKEKSKSDLLQWNANTGTYRLVTDDSSIAQLRQGRLKQFLLWMSSTYYEEPLWLAQVLRLFPDAPKIKLFDTYAPKGSNEEQDALWRWVEENEVLLQWQGDRKEYRLLKR